MRKVSALVLVCSLLHSTFYPVSLLAVPSYQDRAKSRVQSSMDRADRLTDQTAWTNYVDLGIATQLMEWDAEAAEELRREVRRVEGSTLTREERTLAIESFEADLESRRIQWEADAQEHFLDERGKFAASKADMALSQVEESVYDQMIQAAEASVASIAELDLDTWESAIRDAHAGLAANFDASLGAKLTTARAAAIADPEERASFEAELDQIAERIRREFEMRDSFFMTRAKNKYIQLKRADDVSARLASDLESAEQITNALIDDTEEAANETVAQVAGVELSSAPDSVEVFGKRVEDSVQAGLLLWQKAEEDLYAKRLTWMDQHKKSRAEAEKVWSANHEKLKAARNSWSKEVQVQIAEGRRQYEEKDRAFAESRDLAMSELQTFVDGEMSRRNEISARTGDMIRGGGASLAQAKDAYNYYNDLVSRVGEPVRADYGTRQADYDRDRALFRFYETQRSLMRAAIASFGNSLSSSEDVLRDVLHSGTNSSGLLVDRRVFAGDLPLEIEGLSAGNFRAELENLIQERAADLPLYTRDLSGLIAANSSAVERIVQIKEGTEALFAGASDRSGLFLVAATIAQGQERSEILTSLQKSRSGTEAEQTAAMQAEIARYFAVGSDEDARLRAETLRYFESAGPGAYATANENDPYMMTQAEYDWELLRRDRAALARRLRRAEEVKRYADIAKSHQAGLEMASITEERAEMYRVHAELAELLYLAAKGDLAFDALVKTDNAVLETELHRILGARGISAGLPAQKEAELDALIAFAARFGSLARPEGADLTSLIADAEVLATASKLAVSLRDRLLEMRDAPGQDAASLDNRWTGIVAAAGASSDELSRLKADYRAPGAANLLSEIRAAMQSRTTAELATDLSTRRADLESSAQALSRLRQNLDEKKNIYQAAYIDFQTIASGSAEDLIRIEITDALSRLGSVIHGMHTIQNLPGMAGLLTLAEKESAAAVLEAGQAQTSALGLAAVSSGLDEFTALRSAKARTEILRSIVPGFAALSGRAAADEIISRKASILPATDDAAGTALRNAVLNLERSRLEINALETRIASALPTDKPALELARDSLELKTLHSASALLEIAEQEDAARLRLFNAWLSGSTSSADPAAVKLAEEAALTRAERIDADAIAIAANLLRTNQGRTSSEIASLARALIAAAPRDASPANQAAQDERMKAARAADLIGSVLRGVDQANDAPTPSDSRTQTEKWQQLSADLGDAESSALVRRDVYGAVPSAMTDTVVVEIRARQAALKGALDSILSGGPGTEYAAYLALSSADRSELAQYGTVRLDKPRASMEAIGQALEAELSLTDPGQIYLNSIVRSNAAALGPQMRVQSEKSEIVADLALSAQAREVRRTDLIAQIAVETDPIARGLLEAERDAISAELVLIGARLDVLRPELEAIDARVNTLSAAWMEARQRGSSSPDLAGLFEMMRGDSARLQLMSLERRAEDPRRSAQEILNTASGVDLAAWVTGNRSGREVTQMADRVVLWMKNADNTAGLSASVKLAVEQLTGDLRRAAIAKERILRRDADPAALKAEANLKVEESSRREKALAELDALEGNLANLLSTNGSLNGLKLAALDPSGFAGDPALENRARELLLKLRDYAAITHRQAYTAAAGIHNERVNSRGRTGSLDYTADRAASLEPLKGGTMAGIVAAIAPDADFKKNLIEQSDGLDVSVRSEIVMTALLSGNTGAELKAEILAIAELHDQERQADFGRLTAEAEKNAGGIAARMYAENRADFTAAVNEFAATISEPGIAGAVLEKASRGRTIDALLLSEAADEYDAADYAPELHELVLSRAMEKLNARFAQNAADPDQAVDLSGLPEQFVKYAISKRLTDRAANLAAYLSANPGGTAKGWARQELHDFSGLGADALTFAEEVAGTIGAGTAQTSLSFLPGGAVPRAYSEVAAEPAFAFLLGALDGDQGLNDVTLLFHEAAKLGVTDEAEKEYAIVEAERQTAAAALAGILEGHRTTGAAELERIRGERTLAQDLLKFADELLVPLEQRRILNDRAFPGAASTYLESQYDVYSQETIAAGQTPVTRNEFFAASQTGALVNPGTEGQSAATVLAGVFESTLRTDPFAGTSVVVGTATIEVRTRHQVSALTTGSTQEALQEIFYASLANDYIESTSDVERALQRLASAAALTDAQPNETGALAAAHSGLATDAEKEAALLARKQALQADAADHSEAQVQERLTAAQNAFSEREAASQEYAEAARRQLLRTLGATQFIETVFRTASDDLATARADFDAAAQTLNSERQIYMDQNALYTSALDRTSKAYSSFVEKREAYETAVQVKEYAATPYLYSSSTDASDPLNALSQDADNEVERARAMYAQVQNAMEDQSIVMAAQDRLSEFSALADKVAAGQTFSPLGPVDRNRLSELQSRQAMPHNEFGNANPLSVDETAELTTLRERELFEIWGDTISKRAEHISHSLRMIRIEKAATLVQGEVARREAAAAQAKARFERALETNFGMSNLSSDTATREGQIAARNTVYKRLANLEEATNGAGFYNEYKSWFWGGSAWYSSYGGATTSTYLSGQPQNVQVTPGQQFEALSGMLGAASMPDADKQAIGTWMGAGGSLSEFTGFSGVYYSFLAATGFRDMKLAENMITKGIYMPLMQVSMVQFAYAQSLQAAAAALGPFGVPLALSAGVIRTAALAQFRLSQQMLMRAEAQFAFAQSSMLVMQIAALASARSDSVRNVRQKEMAYEEAQAGVDYFTKIPNLQTLKERLIQWGSQHGDDDSANNLYDISDDDLRYLFSEVNGTDEFTNSDGSPTTISATDRADAIDLTDKTQTESFRDSLGRRYDPATLTSSVPGPLVGGVYQGGDGNYTRVRTMQHNGATVFQYAKILDSNPASTDTPANTRTVFNLAEISRIVAEHGRNLLAEKKSEYIAAGDVAAAQRGDTGFLLAERDSTFSQLFGAATDQDIGGREFAGYTNTFADYEANSARIGSTEVQQRAAVQMREWEIREQELAEKRDAWENKVGSILSRGQKQFAANEDRYLMEWRNWSREQDREKAEAEKQWKEKIDATLTAKVDWKKKAQEELTTSTISRTMQETFSALNAQLASIRQNTGIQTSPINVAAAIQETIAEIRLAEPKSERLKEINQEIATFNTRISLSELTQQRAGSLDAVENAFTALMTDHSREMTVLANAKAHDRYRQIIVDFMEQYEDQNKKIDLQTASAAGSAGYVRAGGIYVKPGENTAGVVHAYTFFDTKGAINQALANVGFSEMNGNALVDFLKNKSDAEVGAYFKMQQTALTLAFEKVAGKGSSAERENSRDERVIGSFGKWAGKQQDSSTANQLVTHGGPNADPAKAQQAGDYLSYVSFSGFGELGETALRPSSVGPGFYVELELSNRIFGQEMARQQMKGMGSLDPASTFVNQYNPVAMMAQATQNVRLATLTQGKSEGYMWEAQALNMLKAPIVATGSAMMMFAPTIGPLAPVLFAAGAVVSAAGNSINVNPTTGERIMKMDDRAAVTTAVSIAGSAFAASGVLEGFTKSTQQLITVGQSASTAALQSAVRYDSEGRSQGMSFNSHGGDYHGENVLISAAVAGATSYAGSAYMPKGLTNVQSELFGDMLSMATNVGVEYGKQQTWGKDKSGYDALGRPDAGRLGALAGTIGTAAYKDHKAAELKAAREAEIAQADKLAREGQKQKAVEILMAGGYFKDRRDAEAYVQKVKAQADGLPEGDLVRDSKGNLFVRDKDGRLHPLPKGDQSRAGVELAMPGFMSDTTEYIKAWAQTMERAVNTWEREVWDIPGENSGSKPSGEANANTGVNTVSPQNKLQEMEEAYQQIAPGLPEEMRRPFLLALFQEMNVVGPTITDPYQSLGNRIRGFKDGFNNNKGYVLSQGFKDVLFKTLRALSMPHPLFPETAAHRWFHAKVDGWERDSALKEIGRLYGDLADNPKAQDYQYARGYIDGFDSNLRAGRVIADGMTLVGPSVLTKTGRMVSTAFRFSKPSVALNAGRSQMSVKAFQQGIEFEETAIAAVKARGETVIATQYTEGAASKGLDFISIRGNGEKAQVILNEAKSYSNTVRTSDFSALGVNKVATLEKNIAKAIGFVQEAQRAGSIDAETAATVIRQLQNNEAQIRLIGNGTRGTWFSQDSVEAIEAASGLRANVTKNMKVVEEWLIH